MKRKIDKDKAFHTINQRKYWQSSQNVNIEIFREISNEVANI